NVGGTSWESGLRGWWHRGASRSIVHSLLPCRRREHTTLKAFNLKFGSEMPKLSYRPERSSVANSHFSGLGFWGSTGLAIIPVFAIFYLLLILPFLPNEGTRTENILFWPVVAALTSAIVFLNWPRIDYKFFLSLPIMSLIAYLAFAAASVTWAYSPDFAFS